MRTYYPGTYRPRPPRRRGRRLAALLILLIICGLAAYGFSKRSQPTGNESSKSTAVVKDADIKSVDGNYLFNGTVVLARAVENQARGDYNQPFSGLHTFSPEKYDAWLADFECPITTQNIPYRQQVANTMFNCRPEFLPTYRKYFQFANIAGNHTRDLGMDGYEQTVQHLLDADIIPLGNYSPRVKEDLCEVVAMPVRAKKASGEVKKVQLPVAICSFHYFSFEPEPGEIETVKSYSQRMPVFALMHIGTEYVATAGPNQVDVARSLIDNGADFVIGNSPHWVQNSEVYKGKLIVYSTGNFIFDQIEPETQRGVSIGVKMNLNYNGNVERWLELAEKCKARHDNCLELAAAQNLQKVSPKFVFDAIGNSNGYLKITKRADPTLQAAIESRLNWSRTLRQLGQ